MPAVLGKSLRALLVVTFAACWCLALAVGPHSGQAFAFQPPPADPPPVATLGGATVSTDTAAVVAGADATVTADAVGAGAVCAAATAGTCAVAAVAVAGVAYGTYKLIHWAWGGHHTPQQGSAAVSGSTITLTGNGYACGSCTISTSAWAFAQNANGTAAGGATFSSSITNQFTFTVVVSNFSTADGASLGIWVQCNDGGTNSWGALGADGSYSGGPVQCPNPGTYPTQWGAYDRTYHVIEGGGALSTVGAVTGVPATQPAPLPQHTMKVQIQCLDGSGHVVQTVTMTSPSFDDSSSSIPDTPANPCGTGTIPGAGTVTETTTGQPDTPVESIPAPNLDPANPCSFVGAACRPTVMDNNVPVPLPINWDSTSNPRVNGYECEWAVADYSTGTLTTDGGPLSMTDCVAADPNPPTSKGPSGVGSGDGTHKGCMSAIVSFNPVDWVYVPVKCVLTWAFVPSNSSVETQTSALRNAWDSTPPGVMVGAAGRLFAPFVDMSQSTGDCAGPLVAFDLNDPSQTLGSHHLAFHPFDMCNPIGQWVHDWAMPLVTACIYMATFVICLNILGWAVGLHVPFSSHLETSVV